VTSLPFLLGVVMTAIQSCPVYIEVTEVETRESSRDQFFFKVRATLSEGFNFQARIYYNNGHIDYAYQVFADAPILRWDNKEEFRQLETYPHHYHDENGNVKPSLLKGDTANDIEIVLQEIRRLLSREEAEK